MVTIPSSTRNTLSSRVLASISSAILSGEHPAGERLHDQDIAERMGVSRTPVREAIVRLANAGVIEIVASRYTRVADFTALDRRGIVRYAGRVAGLVLVEELPSFTSATCQSLLRDMTLISGHTPQTTKGQAIGRFLRTLSDRIDSEFQRTHLMEIALTAECVVRFGASVTYDARGLTAAATGLTQSMLTRNTSKAEESTRHLFQSLADA